MLYASVFIFAATVVCIIISATATMFHAMSGGNSEVAEKVILVSLLAALAMYVAGALTGIIYFLRGG